MFAPLVGWLGPVLTSIFVWLAQVFGKKIAIALSGVAAWGLVAGTMLLGINAIINPLIQSIPSGYIAVGISMLPGNTTQCISAVMATHAACFVFETANRVLNIKLQA